MSVSNIIDGLESSDLTGADAAQAARLGFLEWAFCTLDGGTPQAAREALQYPAARNASSAAAQAFVDYLRQATLACARPRRRRVRVNH